jgi:peptidoglycan/xylan/chitin deacetylase (PgdA/CDA1 family)
VQTEWSCVVETMPNAVKLRRKRMRWLRPLLGILSPAGSRGRLTTLIFHRVHHRPDPLFPLEMHAAAFLERLDWIRGWFNVMDLEEAVTALAVGKLPARALAITFDDGYADNYSVALPLLRQAGLSATFFVASGYLDGGCMWNDAIIESVRRAHGSVLNLSPIAFGTHDISSIDARRRLITTLLSELKYRDLQERSECAREIAAAARVETPRDLMMTSAQVRHLAAAGMGVGAHTKHHPILARTDEPTARQEIADGREILESIVGRRVALFAYPNGKPGQDYTVTHVRMTRELGFVAAFSTAPGAARTGSDRYQLPRFTPWDRTAVRWSARLARNFAIRPEHVIE